MANTAGVRLTVRGHRTIPSYGQTAVRRIRRSEMDNPWAPKGGRIVNTMRGDAARFAIPARGFERIFLRSRIQRLT
jgi:hypothetical protein